MRWWMIASSTKFTGRSLGILSLVLLMSGGTRLGSWPISLRSSQEC
jgi:hypothetical protein